VIWLATLGLAAIVLLRPGGLGTLLALAANWENVPWSDTYTPPAQRSVTIPEGPSGPVGPGASARPAAWPGRAASGVSDPPRQDPRDPDARPEPSQSNPLRYSEPSPPPEDSTSRQYPPAPSYAADPGYREGNKGLPQDEPPAANAVLCEGAEILGRVGSEVILTKELSWGIAELRSKNKDVPPEVLEAKIREVLKQRLDQKIDEKLVYLDAKRTLPAEGFPKIKDNVARGFETSEVPRLMKATNARTRQELEDSLQVAGSSLEMQKRNFVDQVLAHEWLRQQIKIDEEVSREQALTYYREQASQFETPARARWEQLMVRASRFPSRADAYAALAEMGNQVFGGAPLAEVAKAQSHGSTAPQGGFWDWTGQRSLASPMLDRAIFGDGERPGIPVGALSPILEDEQAFHIIRVLEREPTRRTPFREAQVEIKKKIRAEREVKAKQDYVAKLRRQTPVWSAFDAPATAQRPSPGRYLQ
jgi:parvulin-like peptidyl-prolyl isomerase